MQTRNRAQALSLAAGLILVTAAAAVGGLLLLLQHDSGPSRGSTWNFYEVDGTTLTVHKTIRPCDEVTSASAKEVDDHVEVTLHVDFGGVCADSAVDGSAVARLQAPLDGRLVYDAACLADGPLRDACLRGEVSDRG